MHYLRTKTLLFLLIIRFYNCNSQSINYEAFSETNGLPDDIIYNIMQSQDGHLWLGTDNGLSRFDGSKFENFKGGANFVIDLAEIGNNRLLLGTWKTGFHIFQGDSVYKPISNYPDLDIAQMQIRDCRIVSWNTNSVSFSHLSGDSIQISSKFLHSVNGSLRFHSNPVLNDVIAIQYTKYFKPNSKDIWLYNSVKGLVQFGKDSVFKPVFENILRDDTIYSIGEDLTGVQWIGANGKIQTLEEPSRIVCGNLHNQKIEYFQFASPSKLFFYTGPDPDISNRRLYEYNLNTASKFPIDKKLHLKSVISNIAVDKEMNLWVATNGDGLRRIRYPYVKNLSSEIESPFITTISNDGSGHVLIGTVSNGIYRISTDDYKSSKVSPHLNKILCLASSEGGDKFIGTHDGFLINGIQKSSSFIESVSHIQDDWWIVWGGRTVGLINEQQDKYKVIHLTGKNYEIRKGFVDKQQRKVWLATSKGVLTLDFNGFENFEWKEYFPKNERLIVNSFREIQTSLIDKRNGLPSNNVFDIKRGNNESIWIATDQGLSEYKNMELNNYSDERFWPGKVNALLVDQNGVVWLGTKGGLVFFVAGEFGIFTKNHGLVSNNVTTLNIDERQQLWVGGVQGVSVFDNTEKPIILSPPNAQISNILINDSVSKYSISNLSENDRIRLKFKAVSMIPEEDIEYRVRLDKEPWHSVSQKHIDYQRLRHGSHVFEVAARYKNGKWGDPSKHLLTIHPPWWRTWYFRLGLVASVLFIFIFSIKYVQMRNEKKYQEKVMINKQLAELELKALQAQMNPHFIFNALNSIQMIIWDRDEENANKYLTEFSRLMRLYLESSRNEYHSLEEEIEFITLYSQLESLRFKDDLVYNITVDSHLDLQQEFPTMIIQPFVENAINHGLLHSKKDRRLSVVFKVGGDVTICIIDDNGVGRKASADLRSQSKQYHISRATQIVEEKIEALRDSYDLNVQIRIIDKLDENRFPSGTTVKISVPV